MKGLLQFIVATCLLHTYQPLKFQRSKIVVLQDKLKSMRVISTEQNEKKMNLFHNVEDFVRKIFPDENKITGTREDNSQKTVPVQSTAPVVKVPEVKVPDVKPQLEVNTKSNKIEGLLWTGITGLIFFILAVESSKYFFPLALLLGSFQVLRSAQSSSKAKNIQEEVVAALKVESPIIVPINPVTTIVQDFTGNGSIISKDSIGENNTGENLQFGDSTTTVETQESRVQPLSQMLIQRLTDLREDLKGQLSLHDDMQVELSALKTVISSTT